MAIVNHAVMDQTMKQSLQISLSKYTEGTIGHRFVHLTQPIEDGMNKTASIFDISQMIERAKSGMSAHTYKKDSCPAGVTKDGVTVRLDFNSWPSYPTIKHTIYSNIGEVSPPEIIEEYTEFSLVFGMTSVVEIDFILKDITSIKWETPCYDKKGRMLFNKEVWMDGLTTVRTSEELFGVVRICGTKVGAKHTLVANIIKSYPIRPDEPILEEGITSDMLEEYWAYTDVNTWNGEPVDENDTVDMTGLSIDNLSIVITSEWLDKDGKIATEQIGLNIPQCIQDLLSNCDGNLENSTNIGTKACSSDDQQVLTVYISSCTGKVIEERITKEDPDSWCE